MLDKQWLKDVLRQCEDFGYRTVPFFPKGHTVDGFKMPSRKFADGQDYKKLGQYTDAVSVAVVLEDCILLDYDGNKGDPMPIEELEDALSLFEMPDPMQINAEGDSIHWMFKLPEGYDSSTLADSKDGAWPNIDIKRGNQLVHLKPHKTLHLLSKDAWDVAPDELLDMLKGGQSGGAVTNDDDMGLLELVEAQEDRMDFDTLTELVGSLPQHRADDHQSWYNVGMAIWYETRGSEEGLELFKTFSMQSDKYDESALESRWPSFKHGAGRKPITGGSLHYWVEDAEFDNRLDMVADLTKRISEADEKALMRDLSKEISRLELDSFDREKLATAIRSRAKELTGATMKIGVARELIAPSVAFGEFTEDLPRPDWCNPWVWVDTHGSYFHMDKKRIISSTTFNMEYSNTIPPNDQGIRMSADRFVSSHGFVEVADKTEYLPTEDARLIETQDGTKVFNTFDKRSLPVFSKTMTEEGRKAVEVVREHFKFMCNGNEADTHIFEQWFAHQVQNKGVKILWCPLFCSIEGTGKGAMGELLELLLGNANVGTVGPDDAKSKYRGWAQNRCVNILNELHVEGSNRYEVANALKPIISDPIISIEEKHVKVTNIRNVTNYLAFTNYGNSIPVDENTRRWWPIRINIDSLDDMEAYTGLDKVAYFERLFDAIRGHWKAIGLWLSEYEITKEFTSLKQAPMTEFKGDMIATERTRHEGYDDISEVIKAGGHLIHRKVVSLSALTEALLFDVTGGEPLTQTQIKVILKKMGFMSRSQQLKYNGEVIRVWSRGSYSNDEIRAFLDEKG